MEAEKFLRNSEGENSPATAEFPAGAQGQLPAIPAGRTCCFPAGIFHSILRGTLYQGIIIMRKNI
jgi:hypothetical protein